MYEMTLPHGFTFIFQGLFKIHVNFRAVAKQTKK